MKNDIPNIPSHLHISDSNLLQYEFHHIAIKFYCKISLVLHINFRRLLLEDSFLPHKKCIFLNMPAKLVLRIRNFVKMQRSLPTLLKILVFHNFFSKLFWQLCFKNINFLTKTKKCLLCWILWIQKYQMTGKYRTSNTTFFKKVNHMKYRI